MEVFHLSLVGNVTVTCRHSPASETKVLAEVHLDVIAPLAATLPVHGEPPLAIERGEDVADGSGYHAGQAAEFGGIGSDDPRFVMAERAEEGVDLPLPGVEIPAPQLLRSLVRELAPRFFHPGQPGEWQF